MGSATINNYKEIVADPNSPEGWQKMQYIKNTYDGTMINIHYVAQWSDGIIKAVGDFKFK